MFGGSHGRRFADLQLAPHHACHGPLPAGLPPFKGKKEWYLFKKVKKKNTPPQNPQIPQTHRYPGKVSNPQKFGLGVGFPRKPQNLQNPQYLQK